MSHFKRRHGGRHCAMTAGEDNDTSAQSQPCRDAGSRNEDGFGRTPEGPAAHEKAAATLRLIVSCDPGRRGQIWIVNEKIRRGEESLNVKYVKEIFSCVGSYIGDSYLYF